MKLIYIKITFAIVFVNPILTFLYPSINSGSRNTKQISEIIY